MLEEYEEVDDGAMLFVIIAACMFLNPSFEKIQIMHGFDENECVTIVNILLLLLFSSSSSHSIANNPGCK